jgi:hypothetical protein
MTTGVDQHGSLSASSHWVKRVVLTMARPLPTYPDKETYPQSEAFLKSANKPRRDAFLYLNATVNTDCAFILATSATC